MNFWNLVLFAVKKTPEAALAILRDLRPSQWKLFLNGVEVPDPHYSFGLVDALKSRMLVLDITYTLGGMEQEVRAMTRLKNDGSDNLTLNGVAMGNCDFEFHSKPLRKQFAAELGYTDASGEKNVIELMNS